MTLGFSTQWPKHMGGGNTYFPEKIIASLVWEYPDYDWESFGDIIDTADPPYDCTIADHLFKSHTIREDHKSRWMAGMVIHYVIFNRTPKRFQFAPLFPCQLVQRISIYQVANIHSPYAYKIKTGKTYQVSVDGRCLLKEDIIRLAINDGFNSVEAFFKWFNKDFHGKIIHWTQVKY